MQIVRLERKLSESNGTIYLALPKDWLRANNLVRRSEVSLFVDETGTLHIRPSDRELDFQERTRIQRRSV